MSTDRPRLIAIMCPTEGYTKHCRIYRLPLTNEWCVRWFEFSGIYKWAGAKENMHEFASSFHDDKDDALSTAEWEIKRDTNCITTFIGGSVLSKFYAHELKEMKS